MSKQAAKIVFSIHYDEDGKPRFVKSESDKVKIFEKDQDSLPRGVHLEGAVENATILTGRHNPYCRYIWIPGMGWTWVCNI